MLHGTVLVKKDPDEVAQAGVELFALASHTARARFRVALAGGRTPKAMYALLAQRPRGFVDWPRVIAFFSDERWVPRDHPDSNYRMVCEAGLDTLPGITLEPVPTELPPVEAANAYRDTLAQHFFSRGADLDAVPPPRLEMVLLGMGADGHTASLFPGSRAVHETARWIADVPPDGVPLHSRVTMTLPLINAAQEVVLLVTGADKRATLDKIRAAPATPPAELIAMYPILGVRPSGTLTWILDEAAAGDAG